MAGTMTSSSTAILAAYSILQILHLASSVSHAFLQVNFTSKWWLRSAVEARKFIENKFFTFNENRLQ